MLPQYNINVTNMGVKYDNEQQRFVFDFEHDDRGDIVSLTGDGY